MLQPRLWHANFIQKSWDVRAVWATRGLGDSPVHRGSPQQCLAMYTSTTTKNNGIARRQTTSVGREKHHKLAPEFEIYYATVKAAAARPLRQTAAIDSTDHLVDGNKNPLAAATMDAEPNECCQAKHVLLTNTIMLKLGHGFAWVLTTQRIF